MCVVALSEARSLQGERRRGGKTGGAIEEQGEREMYETK